MDYQEQYQNYLAQAHSVAYKIFMCYALRMYREILTASKCLRTYYAVNLAYLLRKADWLIAYSYLVGFYAAHIQYVVDKSEQMIACELYLMDV